MTTKKKTTMTKHYNLIFDFDGTLVDSFDAAIQKFNLIAYDLNLNKISPQQACEFKHLSSKELFKQLNIPFFKIPMLLRQARTSMREEISSLGTFIDLPDVLKELHQQHYSLGILTSNSMENVISWLEKQQMSQFFDFIHAESSYFGKKYLLKKLIQNYQMNPQNTFYIGDETRDVEAAHKSKIGSIAVAWGFNSEKTLSESNPTYIAKAPKDILTFLHEL